MKQIFKNYMVTDYHFDKTTTAAIFFMLFAFGGVFGFVYEVIFYYLNSGMENVYWRGGCFGPWINIYGFGALLVLFLTYKYRRKPLIVALIGGLGCGLFEFVSGAVFYYVFDGHRGWDYNVERWNFGNIGGFICLRSVVVFALSSLLMIYVLLPFIIYLQEKMNKKAFYVLSFLMGTLFAIDNIYNFAIAPRSSSLVTAGAFYAELGLQSLHFG